MRRAPLPRPRAVAAILVLLLLLLAAIALARPGGGGSYGGGDGGGGGDAGIIIDLILLCFTHPYIGVPLLIIVVVLTILAKRKKAREGWSTKDGVVLPAAGGLATRTTVSRTALDRIRAGDPDFSVILFEDFLYLLYAELQRARGAGKLEELSAYLTPTAQAQLRADPAVAEVKGIVIGGMRYLEASGIGEAPAIKLKVELEVNLTEVARAGGEQRLYLKDILSIARAREARSRPFARARRLDCPNCGAPLSAIRGNRCESCSEQVGGGRFDWTVEAIQRLATETRPPLLTSDVDERGNELPTVSDPGVQARSQALQARDPSFSWTELRKRLELIFRELQLGWSSRDWMRVRPFVSDNLFQSQMYWIDLYRQARARNLTENARVLRVEVANVLSDRHYDAITVRVFATGLDYTLSDDGKLLSGNRTRERPYSEYWTLIRGVAAKGSQRGERACPNCGAPLTISMAGSCEYCQAKITSGEFDWVLSRIEQDEAYAG